MAKNGVEGVYTADPAKDPTPSSSPRSPTRRRSPAGLQVMDSTAFALCMDNNLPIVVFNMADGTNIDRIVSGERVGTLVRT
jgi:uridylate kinase